MKKLFKLSMIPLALVTFTLTSCDDDDELVPVAPTPLTASQKLVGKDFLTTDYRFTNNGTVEATFADFDDCDKDDITRFEENGNLTFDEGAMKCDPNDPQVETNTWTLISNDTKLVLDYGGGDTDVYTILTNDGITLKVEETEMEDTDGDGNDETLVTTFTFTKK